MTDIPFVRALGDDLERAAAERVERRRSRLRRRITGGAIGLALVGAGTAAATGLFSASERLAGASIACYDQPRLDREATGIPATQGRSPQAACAALGEAAGPLTACAAPEHIAVLPGGRGVCARVGLRPLPVGHDSVRSRVRRFEREVLAVERSSPCVSPEALAARTQELLERGGWPGWRAEIRWDLGRGPCARVTGVNGDGSRTVDGSFDGGRRVVWVFPDPT